MKNLPSQMRRDLDVTLRAAKNESGERSGVSPPVPRFCTGKLTHAARQFFRSRPRGVQSVARF